MSTPHPPTTHNKPLARRIAAEIDTPELEITAIGNRVQIAGTSGAIDRLLARIQPAQRPCTERHGQLTLLDPTPYTTSQPLPVAADGPHLRLASSTDRGAA